MYPIEKGFVPPDDAPLLDVMPMDKLEVGDSFVVPYGDVKYGTVKVRAWRYSQANDVRLRVFKMKSGTRVYRAR